MMQSYESLLCRFTPTGAGSPRPWYASLRGAHHFPSQPGKPQALARRSARYWRFHPSAPQRWLRADQHHELRAQVAAYPDATLAEHATLWNAAHASTISQWTIGRAIRLLGLTRKKSRGLPVNVTLGSVPAFWASKRTSRQLIWS